jgi:hypothetical protein
MYEERVRMRIGEIKPVFGQSKADRGLLTLQSGATFMLYDAAGEIVAGFDGVAITGNSVSPAREINIWYLLDSTNLTAQLYTGLFTYNITSSSDVLNRRDRPGVQIDLLPAVETPALWDTSTNEGKTRIYLSDLDKSNPIWTSEVVAFLLSETGGIPIRAAALGFNVAAGSAAYLALYDRAQTFSVDRRQLPQALRDQATSLRELSDTELADLAAGAGGSVNKTTVEIFPATTEADFEPNFARPWGVAAAGARYTLEGDIRRCP